MNNQLNVPVLFGNQNYTIYRPINDDIEELAAMRNLANILQKIEEIAIKLDSLALGYMNTRSFLTEGSDQQNLANKVFTLKQMSLAFDYINTQINGIGSVAISLARDIATGGMSPTLPMDSLNLLGVASKSVTEAFNTYQMSKINACQNKLDGISRLEECVKSASMLIESIKDLKLKLETARKESQGRLRNAKEKFQTIKDRMTRRVIERKQNILVLGIISDLDEFNFESRTRYTEQDILPDEAKLRDYLQWFENNCLTHSQTLLNEIQTSEDNLTNRITIILKQDHISKFFDSLERDCAAIIGLDSRKFPKEAEFLNLAAEAGIDDLAMASIVSIFNDAIEKDILTKHKKESVLKDALEKCVSARENQYVPKDINALYLLFRIEKTFHKAAIDITPIANVLGLQNFTKLIPKYYHGSGRSVKDSIKIISLIGEGNQSLLIKLNDLRKELRHSIPSDEQVKEKLAIEEKIFNVMLYYIYQRLIHAKNIFKTMSQERSDALFKMSYEIVKATLGIDNAEIKMFSQYPESLFSDFPLYQEHYFRDALISFFEKTLKQKASMKNEQIHQLTAKNQRESSGLGKNVNAMFYTSSSALDKTQDKTIQKSLDNGDLYLSEKTRLLSTPNP